MSKVPCTKNDLEKAEEIFSHAIHAKLADSKLNLDKIVQEFHNLLDMNLTIQPSPEEDHESQELKDKIEKSQKKAHRLKSNLEIYRNQIISGVREKIEQILEQQCPKIDDFSAENILDDEIQDVEYSANLLILDESIKNLLLQLSETNSKMQVDTKKFTNNAMNIENFLKSSS